MKRLLLLTNTQQEKSVRNLLEKNGIIYKQTEPGFFDKASIWVMDLDYPRARELVEALILDDQTKAQIQFTNEWQSKWKSSYFLWFFGSIRENPARIFRLIVLIGFLVIFLWYPITIILTELKE
jgi:hypothetical protein